MKPISTKTLRDVTWRQVYKYDGRGMRFVTFAADDVPGLTITHERALVNERPVGKVKTTYSVRYPDGARRTDSPIQAVRLYNEQARAQATGDQSKPGSVGALRAVR